MMSTRLSAQESQRTLFVVSFSEEVTFTEIKQQIPLYNRLGIEAFELPHPIETALLDSLAKTTFQVMVRRSEQFLTTTDLRANQEVEKEAIQRLIDRYAPYDQVNAVGLYSYSQSYSPAFKEALEELASTQWSTNNVRYYEITTNPNSSLAPIYHLTDKPISVIDESTSAFFSAPFSPQDFSLLIQVMEKDPVLVLFDQNWLENALETNPEVLSAMEAYALGEPFVLPLPNIPTETPPFNWPVFVFLLLWILVGIHMITVPTYRYLLLRYFTFHRFFVDDIMRYRERSAASGVFLIIQHSLFTGLLGYLLSATFISETGLSALFHHFPLLGIFGTSYFSLFAVSVLIAVFVQLIELLWLYLPSKSMRHFSQTLSLYTWMFHLDFLVVSIMLILYLTHSSPTMIFILGIIFILIWITTFVLTAIDSAKYLMKGKVGYVTNTAGLNVLITLLLFSALFAFPSIVDVISLAITL